MFWKVQEVLTTLEYCNGDLVEHLQLWDGSVGQVHSLDIWMDMKRFCGCLGA
jgi:hypothetical protein